MRFLLGPNRASLRRGRGLSAERSVAGTNPPLFDSVVCLAQIPLRAGGQNLRTNTKYSIMPLRLVKKTVITESLQSVRQLREKGE